MKRASRSRTRELEASKRHKTTGKATSCFDIYGITREIEKMIFKSLDRATIRTVCPIVNSYWLKMSTDFEILNVVTNGFLWEFIAMGYFSVCHPAMGTCFNQNLIIEHGIAPEEGCIIKKHNPRAKGMGLKNTRWHGIIYKEFEMSRVWNVPKEFKIMIDDKARRGEIFRLIDRHILNAGYARYDPVRNRTDIETILRTAGILDTATMFSQYKFKRAGCSVTNYGMYGTIMFVEIKSNEEKEFFKDHGGYEHYMWRKEDFKKSK